MIQLLLVLALFTQLSFSFSTDWSTSFDYETYIDEDQLFKLYWTDLPDDIIEFGIEAQATGWIALGISPNGQMPASDIAIGWVDDNGNVYLQDRFTTTRSAPLYDSNQNLTLISGEESDGMTRIRFTRPKYSCDPDDVSLGQGTTRLIWAFHATEDPDTECWDTDSVIMHTNKGSQSLNLDTGVPEVIELEDDVTFIDVRVNNVSVPATETTYFCGLYELPIFAETQHIVKFEPLIENEGTVHHILAYLCPLDLSEHPENTLTEAPCEEWNVQNMPAAECNGGRLVFGWAIGGNDQYLPKEVGIPLSGDSELHYIFIEMHYDNPLEQEGIMDSSGFRMSITPTLRPIDAGTLSVGAWTNPLGQWIPSGLNAAHSLGFMTAECSNDTFPEEGIKIYATNLHAHTIGSAMRLRHIRNGQELKPIDVNWNYDFNYQQFIYHQEPITMLPGDELIVDCWLDSSERSEITVGGLGSSQEMCIAFLSYYPEIELIAGYTAKTPETLSGWMSDAQRAGYLSGNATDLDLAFSAWPFDLESFEYNSDADGAQEFYNRLYSSEYDVYNKHFSGCRLYDGTDIETDSGNVPIPNGFEEYDADIFSCGDDELLSEETVMGECVPSDDATTDTPITSSGDVEDPNKVTIIHGYLSIFWAIFASYNLV